MSPIQYEPTLKVYQPFNPNDDAGKLYKAMKGFGTGNIRNIKKIKFVFLICYNLYR